MHFYAWKKGLKTGMYYLRTKAARDAVKFTVTKGTAVQPITQQVEKQASLEILCSLDNPDNCEMCSG